MLSPLISPVIYTDQQLCFLFFCAVSFIYHALLHLTAMCEG